MTKTSGYSNSVRNYQVGTSVAFIGERNMRKTAYLEYTEIKSKKKGYTGVSLGCLCPE